MQKHCFLLVLTILVLMGGQYITNAQPYKIGAIWENDSVVCDEIFASAISKLDKSKLDYEVIKLNVKRDSKKLKETLTVWNSGKVDCIYAIGNGSAILASKVVKDIPTIAFGVSNPKGLGIIKNLQTPEGKLTAVSCYIAPYKQIRTLIVLKPNMKKIGLIYEKDNICAKNIEVPESKKAGQKLGLRIISDGIKTYKDGAKSVSTLKDFLKVDAIIMCANPQVIKATKDIVETAGQMPVLSYDSSAIDRGALFGWVASNEKMGEAVADYTIKILKKDTPINNLPVVFFEKPLLKINIDTLKNVNVDVPESLLKKAKKVKTKQKKQ